MKLKNISLMNIFMCFCVVAIHLTSLPIEAYPVQGTWFKIFFAINRMVRFAVPAFVFLSGYKLFNRYKDENIDLKKFYLSRLKKIVLPYVICYTIYYLYFYNKGWLGEITYFKGLFLGELSAQFYYIIFTVQLYLLFPLFIKVFKRFPQATLFASLLVSLTFKQFLAFQYSYLLFFEWLVYFIFGMYIAKFKPEKVNIKSFAVESIIFIISTILVVITQYRGSVLNIAFEYYASLFIIYAIYGSVFFFDLFTLVSKEDSKLQNGLIKLFDANTYYIFLYHIMFMNICQFKIIPNINVELTNGTKFVVISVFTLLCIVVLSIVGNCLHKFKKMRQNH